MKLFEGRRALITGGAQGIGFAIAQALAREGVRVVLTDIDEERLRAAGEQLDEIGPESLVYQLDVTDHDGIADLRDEVIDELGGIDLLVNNAGIVQGGAFLEVPLDEHLRTFEVNTRAVVAVTHAFLGDLIEAEEGHLVNIASASGFVGLPWGSTYAASKWAVIGFGESIRLELKRLEHNHVGVTSVCPSYVSTGMFEGAQQPLLTPFLTPEKLARKVVRAIRRGDPFVLEPAMVKVMPFLKASLPTGASDAILDAFGASTSMKGWKGH